MQAALKVLRYKTGTMPTVRQFRSYDAVGRQQIVALREILRRGQLLAHGATEGESVADTVREIIDSVRRGGDSTAAELASRLDRAQLSPNSLRVEASRIVQAQEQADSGFMALVQQAADNIRQYQEHILLTTPPPLKRGGRTLGVVYRPLRRVAVYVPGGRALYPSTVLMTVVPALVAGVKEIVMLSPATGGEIHPLALALAGKLGIQEVYRLGGAVGLAAVAHGTESIEPVDKIVGPGNAYVAEAKRQLFGQVGIDAVAGPSEVFIVADATTPAAWTAADLIAQAEHDPGSAILATPDADYADAVTLAVEEQLQSLERREAAAASLGRYGAIIVTETLQEACSWANAFATEHLQIMTADNEACLEAIDCAGAIFVGRHTPVPLGDYFAGPSHVLPTGGTARFSSPLSCNDFLVSSSFLQYEAGALAEDAPCAARFADSEGLTAHARAARIR